MINQEELIKYKQIQEAIQVEQEILAEARKQFDIANETRISNIQLMQEGLIKKKDLLIEAGLIEFEETGIKQLTGGLGIRVSTTLDYDEAVALEWAERNMPVIVKKVLNKVPFNKYAKAEDLDFVNKEEKVSVTFPKEIKC